MKIQQFKGIRQPLTPEQQDQKLKDVGKLYEKQFLREMMKQMRATVGEEGGFIPAGQAEKIFRGQLDEEYVEKWGDKGGIGLADMIHKQLVEKYGAQLGIKPQETRPMGPIKIDGPNASKGAIQIEHPNANHFMPMDESSNARGASGPSPMTLKSLKTTMRYDLQKAALGDNEVTAPWSGTLLGVKSLSADENLLEMAHDNGLKSQMVFRGQLDRGMAGELQPAKLQAGMEIQAGQRLGLLSPEAKTFFWTVDVTDSL
jgi:flagellar protein FlgJ